MKMRCPEKGALHWGYNGIMDTMETATLYIVLSAKLGSSSSRALN